MQRWQTRIVAFRFAQSKPKKVAPLEFSCLKSLSKVSFLQQGQTIIAPPAPNLIFNSSFAGRSISLLCTIRRGNSSILAENPRCGRRRGGDSQQKQHSPSSLEFELSSGADREVKLLIDASAGTQDNDEKDKQHQRECCRAHAAASTTRTNACASNRITHAITTQLRRLKSCDSLCRGQYTVSAFAQITNNPHQPTPIRRLRHISLQAARKINAGPAAKTFFYFECVHAIILQTMCVSNAGIGGGELPP